MVVQCTSCQSKFRIADDKVTERGVRVRCTSCKNVFQVKKAGATTSEPAPGPGSTMELSALDAAALARPSPRNTALGAGRVAAPALRAGPPAPPLPRPAAAARPAPGAKPLSAQVPGAAAPANGRRPAADDLFGMAELTGESPLGDMQKTSAPPPPKRAAARPLTPASRPPPGAKPAAPATRPPAPATRPPAPASAAKPVPSFDDIDIEVEDSPPASRPAPVSKQPAPKGRPLPPLVVPGATSTTVAIPLPAPPPRADAPVAAAPPPPPPPDDLFDESGSPQSPDADDAPVKLGAFKARMQDPFEGMNLGEGGGSSAVDLAIAARKAAAPAPETAPWSASLPEEPQIPYSASREFVSSALTGLVGAALAVAFILAAALSEDAPYGWLGIGAGGDIVATRIVSGLYDTVSGKPVFYVRGRVENRGKKVRGPVRVIAELVGDTHADARADAIAGAEPTPEDVYALRGTADADKLSRSLEGSDVSRRVEPGGSLPFFAVIAEPPADLEGHKLRVRLESVDTWIPPPSKAVIKGR